MIPTKRLGTTDLEISAVGLGAWPFSGGYDWSNRTVPDVAAILSAAQACGINWVDTAAIYEESETALGKALRGRRHQFVLASKGGIIKKGSWPVHDLSTASLTQQLESSLQNLKTDYIDLYQLHYPDPNVPLQEALEVLFRFKKQGKIRAVGVCNVGESDLVQLPVLPDCVQNEFSVLHPQKGKAVFAFCHKKKVPFVGYGTLCGGILSGKYKREPNFRRADARNYFYRCYRGLEFEHAQNCVMRVRQVATRLGQKPASVAVAWALSFPQVTAVLCGAKTPEQLLENAQGAQIKLSQADLSYLESA